jgi:hypothetical protein
MHFRQAIVTRFAGPTNTRGSRVVASAQAGRMTVGWDHALNSDQNHAEAARAFARKLGWTGTMHGGAMPNGRGYAFVFEADGSKVTP